MIAATGCVCSTNITAAISGRADHPVLKGYLAVENKSKAYKGIEFSQRLLT
jgi:hypothetical protein